jgi:nucleoid-associated protein YgaU
VVLPLPVTPEPPRTHIVRPGDYLMKIAYIHYKNSGLWRRIYEANRKVIGPNPDKIFPGQVLVIP